MTSTAVRCGNDLSALGGYEAARRRGRRMREEFSVVGFDAMRRPLSGTGAASR